MSTEELYNLFKDSKGISTDTRTLQPGEIYFALSGENFNGNHFAQDALDKGCAAAIIDDRGLYGKQGHIYFPDALEALQNLSNYHRNKLDTLILAITGSNGKTTTKELIFNVLKSELEVYATKGNLNNHIGVPLSLLSIKPNHHIAVIEMGDNHPGEIQLLCNIAQPDYGIITNVGKDHLEGFGNMEANYKAKGELFDYLAVENKKAFIDTAQEDLMELGEKINGKIYYGGKEDNKYKTEFIEANPFVTLEFNHTDHFTVQSQMIGQYNYKNIQTAIACGVHFGISSQHIVNAIEEFTPDNNRSQVINAGSNRIILDAYNANPSNMEVALESLKSIKDTKRIAILGDMFELGTFSDEEHINVARKCVELNIETVLVGPLFEKAAHQFGFMHFQDAESASLWYNSRNFENTWILIKASRGVKLETIIGI